MRWSPFLVRRALTEMFGCLCMFMNDLDPTSKPVRLAPRPSSRECSGSSCSGTRARKTGINNECARCIFSLFIYFIF